MVKMRKKLLLVVATLVFLGLGICMSWSTFRAEKKEPLPKVGYYARAVKAALDPDQLFVVSEHDGGEVSFTSDIPVESTLVAESLQIDEMVEAELKSGAYGWDSPLAIVNPYQNAPLSGLILYQSEEPCGLRVTVKGKTEGADLTGELAPGTDHRVPVVGLYPGEETTVLLEELNEAGEAVRSQEVIMQAEALPKSLRDMVEVFEGGGESAYGLTMVFGQSCTTPFAYDCNGDIRWYGTRKVGNYGMYVLSNGHLLAQDTSGYTYSQEKPQTTNLYELDLLGRYHRMYYVANGTHHEVIEKTPGGNLLCLTSSLEDHLEDEIVEIDRQTGEIVKELELIDLFGDTYTDLVDWAHINTVSWQEKEDTILISCRNLHSVIKIGWTDHEIKWILADPAFWKKTRFKKYVLSPVGDFHWHYQQHTSYQLEEDLDGNPDTVEVTVFDNHTQQYRPIETYDDMKDSYAMVYSIDEKAGKVSLLKDVTVVRSTITSNVKYEGESGRLFVMCGYVPKRLFEGRQGLNYEFDYESGELINQFSIKKRYYRAVGLILDLTDLSGVLEVEEDYIKGTLKQPVEVTDPLPAVGDPLPGAAEPAEDDGPKEEEEEPSLKRVGSVLYVSAVDHSISQVIFAGKEHTYVYDAASSEKHVDKYASFVAPLTIPLGCLPADEYQVLCVYKDELIDTESHISVG